MCVWECQREGIFPNKNSGYCSRHPENGIPEGWTEAAASSGACMTVLGTAAPGRWADAQGSGLGSAAPSGLAHGLSGPQGLGWRHAQSPQPAQRTPAPGHLHQRGVPSRLCPATCDSLTPVQGLPGPSRRENAQAHWLPSNLAVTLSCSQSFCHWLGHMASPGSQGGRDQAAVERQTASAYQVTHAHPALLSLVPAPGPPLPACTSTHNCVHTRKQGPGPRPLLRLPCSALQNWN